MAIYTVFKTGSLELKKPDFIVFNILTKSCFIIINEFSQGNPNNKRTTAIQQMHNAALHFDKVPAIKLFIGQFATKSCVFSCRKKAMQHQKVCLMLL